MEENVIGSRNRAPRRSARRLAGTGACLAAALILAGCGASAAEDASTGSEVAVVERRDMEILVEASGLVEPIRVVEVKSKASGEILRLAVETGDEVERGALLAEIDPRDVRNAFAQVEADLAVAQARLSTAIAQRERQEQLRESAVTTQQEYENAVMEEANARAQLVKAQTNLELARERLRDVQIRAPITGTIIQKSVEAGQIIASASSNVSGGTTLMLMADLSEMQVRALIDETDIGHVAAGQVARVSVEAYPGRVFRGRVLKIEPQAVVEQNVTMFPVLVRLPNDERLLKPGMNAEVQIEIAQRSNVVVVPNSSIVAMRDGAAAAAVFGMDEEEFREAMQRARGSGGPGGRGPTGGPPADGNAANGEPGSAGDAAARGAPAGGPAGGMAAGGPPAGGPPAGGSPGARGGRGGRGGQAGGSGETRPALVFVPGPDGPEPRPVIIGLNDWDYTEVVRGLEPGEPVYLMSVARLQQRQEEMAARIRERAGGMLRGAPAGGQGGAARTRR